MTLLNDIKILKCFNQLKDLISYRVKDIFLWDYLFNYLREPKVKSKVNHDPIIQAEIKNTLIKNGFRVIDYKININDYKEYLSGAKYQKFLKYYLILKRRKYFVEKTLEHYIAADLLNLSKNDTYIDVANANSPTPEIYYKLYGCKVYRQDLKYPKGIHGNIIGGDAGDMPLKDDFATKMALHCSFEHFENNSDVNFINEANRILKKNGKLCILPLYLFDKYVIQTDLSVLSKFWPIFDKDALIYCSKGWRNRHGRFYDITHLINRIRNNLKNLKLTIYYVLNEKALDSSCYLKFVALFEKIN